MTKRLYLQYLKKIILLILFMATLVIISQSLKKEEEILDNLIVVNYENKLNSDIDINITNYNEILINEIIKEQLFKMSKSAGRDGVLLVIESAYISNEDQRKLIDNEVKELILGGLEYNHALEEVMKTYQLPGYSEQETGLIVNFESKDRLHNEKMLKWLDEHAYKYGFIKRYPEGKEYITKVNASNNHYRFVGAVDALVIYNENLCLEEYVERGKL